MYERTKEYNFGNRKWNAISYYLKLQSNACQFQQNCVDTEGLLSSNKNVLRDAESNLNMKKVEFFK